MKIAILASNRKPIPSPEDLIFAPGILIDQLTEGLVRRGHDVTLFAPEGTKTSAKLVTAGTKSLYDEFSGGEDFALKRAADLEGYLLQDVQYELLMAATAFEHINKNSFDIVHSHKTLHEIYFTGFTDVPCLFTFHDPSDREVKTEIDKKRLEKYAKSCHFVSISDAQRNGMGNLNWAGTVYNGIDLNKYQFSNGDNDLLFAGRLHRKKGPDIAIEIAQKLGKKLKIAGDVVQSPEGLKFYNEIKGDIDGTQIEFLGHVVFDSMSELYQRAKVLLMPIRWEEPFGLVMIEAMASGTPVVAFDHGSVPEVIKDGVTGFICPPDDVNYMASCVQKIYDMSDSEYQNLRQACRKHVEEKFSIDNMISGYEAIYQKLSRLKNS